MSDIGAQRGPLEDAAANQQQQHRPASSGGQNPQSSIIPSGITRDGVRQIWQRFQILRSQGANEANNPEFARCVQVLKQIQQNAQLQKQKQSMQGQQQQPRQAPQLPEQVSTPTAGSQQLAQATTSAPVAPQKQTGEPQPQANGARKLSAPQSFSNDQLNMLKTQIMAFKMISKNITLPPHIQQAIFATHQSSPEPASVKVAQKTVQQLQAQQTAAQSAAETEPTASQSQSLPQDRDSRKYETYTSPYQHLKHEISSADYTNRQHRLLVPSIMPTGIDVHAMQEAREKAIENRILSRIAELEQLPANLSSFDAHSPDGSIQGATSDNLKLKALIELKALRLVSRQRSLRNDILNSLIHNSSPLMTPNRASFRRMKKQSLREARLTENLERQQRTERERKERQKHLDYLQSVCLHGREILNQGHASRSRQSKLGRSALAYHQYIEKEEQKRTERTAKQRLQALKANDEEAYLKLLDQAKDSRITHLLRQTDSFLSSLAQAVKSQQRDATERYGRHDDMGDDSDDDEDRKVDYYRVAHRIQEDVAEQPSLLVGGTLKDYQIKGLQWMVSLYNNNLNGILADEMGLGKTIQTISLITHLIEKKKQSGPYLVIVPLSTLTNWTVEFEKWAPSIRKIVYKGNPMARKAIQQQQIRYGNFQVLLTTYEYIIKDRPVLSKLKWTYLIVDEGHRMKNAQSKLSSTLSTYYYARYRLILTGTPLQNNLPELWALLNFVLPTIFKSVKSFDEWFNTPFASTGGQDKMELSEEEGLLIIRRLHKVLRPFLLRRLKTDVESELPDKVEKIVKCQMSALQSKLYQQMKQSGILYVNEDEKGKQGIRGLNNTIMQLRKICNHPFVFEGVENSINPTHTNNDSLWRVAGKFELLDRVLPKFLRTGHRVLMFFQMTQIMNIMEDFLALRGMYYLRLDGSTKSDDRTTLLEEFNAPGSPFRIFLLSTRAGGLGLNLQTADTVIIFDSDWNPHQDLQAQDRAHRIGQTKEVRILRLITNKSVEETILERAQYKLGIDERVIQAGKFDNKSTAEEREAFLRGLLEADEADQSTENDQLDDDELNEVIARGQDEIEIFRRMDMERVENSAFGPGKAHDRLMGEDELPDVYLKDFEERFEEVSQLMGRGARERTSIRYDDGLTEEQWLQAMEDEEDSIEGASLRKREKMMRRTEKLKQDSAVDGSETGSQIDGTPPPRKRNRKSAITGDKRRRDDEDGDDKAAKKQRNRSLEVLSERQRGILRTAQQAILDVVSDLEDVNIPGRYCSELFGEVPSRKLYPDYYILIKKPIALDTLQKRVSGTYYRELDEFREDLRLMFNNARTYNEPGSIVYEDANAMEAAMEAKLGEIAPGGVLPDFERVDADEEQPTTADPSTRPSPSASDDESMEISHDGSKPKLEESERE